MIVTSTPPPLCYPFSDEFFEFISQNPLRVECPVRVIFADLNIPNILLIVNFLSYVISFSISCITQLPFEQVGFAVRLGRQT